MTQFDSQMFFKALGLAFVLEGVLWAAFPTRMREAMRTMVARPDRDVRAMGVASMGIGLLVAYLLGCY